MGAMSVEHRTCDEKRNGIDSRRLFELARRQHGVFELGQALHLGYSRAAISRRVRTGLLTRVYPRTYRLAGSVVSREQRAVAACLWAGPSSVASYDTAADLWGIAASGPEVHVTLPRQRTSPPRGIRAHTCGRLAKRDVGVLRGVTLTSPARTVLDLAAGRRVDDLLALVEQTVVGGLVAPDRLAAVAGTATGCRGRRNLRQVLDRGVAEGRWASALEREVARLLSGSGLPPAVRELAVGDVRIDFAWPSARVGVEADGRLWHSTHDDFARDRAKHNALLAAGWRILRVTWRDLRRKPEEVVADLDRLLRTPPYPVGPA